jgi:Ca2+-binding EF-hand superfamily protein
MQVSGLSGSSAASALRALFAQQQTGAQEMPTARQQLPGAGAGPPMQGFGGVNMSDGVMQSLLSMQTGASPGASMSQQLIDTLDANGDGTLSLDEIGRSGDSEAAQAFATLDSDSDGALSAGELTAAFDRAGPPPGPGAHIASDVIDSADTDGDGQVSLTEAAAALGGDEDGLKEAFSKVDADGDGALSLAELTSAFDQYARASVAARTQEQAASV